MGTSSANAAAFAKFTHQQCANQARRIGHGDGIQLLPGDAGLFQRLIRQSGDGLNVLPGRDFRHHAAVDGVHINLTQHTVG